MTLSVVNLQLGADPEVFIWTSKDKGHFISAHDIVPGTKEKPSKTHYGAIQVDGVAAEFNINPTNNLPDWLKRINQGLKHINSLAKHKDPANSAMVMPVATFSEDYFKRLPQEVLELGCNPDYSAYSKMANDSPHTNEYFRTGAGHVHIGWLGHNAEIDDPMGDEKHFNDCISLVKDLDASVYLVSHLWDTDTKRRTLYGKRGSFRPKKYGVEYRPLSNAWLADPLLQAWVFNAVSHTVLLHDAGFVLSEIKELADFSRPFLRNEPISRPDAQKAHDYLVTTLEFPKLPELYLDV